MHAIEVYPRVFFGPAGLTHLPEIAQYTHIVNCDSRRESTGSWARAERSFLWLQSFDEPDYPILEKHLAVMTAFIDGALVDPDSRIYIHCLAGMKRLRRDNAQLRWTLNRSATLAIAYACSKTGRCAGNMIQALRMSSGRFIVGNDGFETLEARPAQLRWT